MAKQTKFILHIGRNKTGTSALQQFFFRNREALKGLGVLYPEIGIAGSGHHGIAGHFAPNGSDLYPVQESWREELVQQAKDFDTVLLSSEAFSVRDPQRVASVFSPAQTRVVVYLREHVHYMTSWYQQSVKASNTSCELRDFVNGNFSPHADLIQRWVDVYGRENVIARVYDRKQFPGGSVIQDFMQFTPEFRGVELGDVELDFSSLSGNLLFIKKCMNRSMTVRESLSVAKDLRKLNRLDPTFSGSIYVRPADVRWIRARFNDDRRTLALRYGIEFAEISRQIRGPKYPDVARFEADWRTVIDYARQHQLGVRPFVEKSRPQVDAQLARNVGFWSYTKRRAA